MAPLAVGMDQMAGVCGVDRQDLAEELMTIPLKIAFGLMLSGTLILVVSLLIELLRN
jgi:hypothetical protein